MAPRRPAEGQIVDEPNGTSRAPWNHRRRHEDWRAREARVANLAADRVGATKLDQIIDHGATGTDHDGFATAYLTHRVAIYSYVRRLMTNESDAEDLTVVAFEKALRAWDRRPSDDELRPWLFRIATNACLDALRRRQRVQWQPWQAFVRLFHPSQVASDNPEEETLRREKAGLVRAALARLSPRDRAALVLRECQGLSVDDVGRALGISRGAAKITLFRARERLRAAYLQLGGELPRDYWTARAKSTDASPSSPDHATTSNPYE